MRFSGSGLASLPKEGWEDSGNSQARLVSVSARNWPVLQAAFESPVSMEFESKGGTVECNAQQASC